MSQTPEIQNHQTEETLQEPENEKPDDYIPPFKTSRWAQDEDAEASDEEETIARRKKKKKKTKHTPDPEPELDHDSESQPIVVEETFEEDDDIERELYRPEQPITKSYPSIAGCRSVNCYERIDRIEEGTYGVVYKARDVETNDIVALKKLKLDKEMNGFPITTLREIHTLLLSKHPHIVNVREIVVGNTLGRCVKGAPIELYVSKINVQHLHCDGLY
jgi:cell division cycle 2-like protein